ncbi:MAG TPA: hypothetical protein VL361_20895 [Candidatus Limnocylindrales bacterium]|jgi:hypothetical protein|nr:hypothetical protein [Candidatus Limnocylindrales bacterium]
MALPREPITLAVGQIDDLNRRLSDMRHDINNHLSLIVAALELIRVKQKKGVVMEAWQRVKTAAAQAHVDPGVLKELEMRLKEQTEQNERMIATLGEQPSRITESIRQFSKDFEQALGIKRPPAPGA